MTRRCEGCHRLFEPRRPHHRRCWDCWRTRQDQAARADAYDDGFRDGFVAGRDGTASHSPNGDSRTLKRAVALTHPDRHPAERQREANEVTAQLLKLIDTTKPRIESRSLRQPMRATSR